MKLRIVALLALLPVLAFGGKEERTYNEQQVQPAVKAAQAAYQNACGCSLKIEIEKTVTSKNALYMVKSVSDDIAKNVVSYCSDDASKKAVCQMKTLHVHLDKDKDPKFEFSGGRGIATISESSYPSWTMMTPKLDK